MTKYKGKWYTSQITIEKIVPKEPKESATKNSNKPKPKPMIPQEEIASWEEKLKKFRGQREFSKIGYSPSVNSDFDKSQFVVEELTSAVFNTEKAPEDWCDLAFLLPHEAIRREMTAMYDSIEALFVASTSENKSNNRSRLQNNDDDDSWKVLYFAEWFVDVFIPIIQCHHGDEEELYFPWIKTKVKQLPPILHNGHDDITNLMGKIGNICDLIIEKEGLWHLCQQEIQELHDQVVPDLCFTLSAHLQSEEELLPPLLRQSFTEEEHQGIMQKLSQREGLSGARLFLPSVVMALEEWAKPEFVSTLYDQMPAAVRYLMREYYLPDYKYCVVPMRDAPKLKTKPTLNKVKCCKIPFCCSCIF
mmetsp:Transcript_20404/g.30278  ORF Transcript_20404/g.30278 Transcript_20404/m.30278 type:complete len:361 (+) Transcript_20404:169-1251(+)|eukprot:CAMPEP_0194208940 /NCGR_PEP_ID=MMETSP0156-20130528/7238_1 /TAXON_ID=33649 /ORGANISM="Thalassionema nitzschioides, Strain L26-B" /LENGTH=360 /DNA_ID=CAMNT_0038936009 /DNA_START=130 /DNA_END=1212 /DNA_ORIENTATION=-